MQWDNPAVQSSVSRALDESDAFRTLVNMKVGALLTRVPYPAPGHEMDLIQLVSSSDYNLTARICGA